MLGGTSLKVLKEKLGFLGINPNEEISQLLREDSYPVQYNPINDFGKSVQERNNFINLLKKKGFLKENLSQINAVELGGGVCSTGAAFAAQCKSVISFELEKVHCLYAKRCKEHFNIDNLGVLYGSISEVDGHCNYRINDNSVDLVISHMGMFRFTVLETLNMISKLLKQEGKFIFVYPRFWTHSDKLNKVDKQLLIRAQEKNSNWIKFNKQFENELERNGFIVEHEGLLEGYTHIPIGGDVILGSKIASSKDEYDSNPIEGIVFGKTLITCNTLICSKGSNISDENDV